MSDSPYNKKEMCKKKIICIETKEIFLGSEWKKLGFDHVHKVAMKKAKHSKGMHFQYYDDFLKNPLQIIDRRKTMKGIWKKIVNYENYEISNLGEVRKGDKLIKPFIGSSGYKTVHLCKHSTQKTIMIHRLVAEAFLDNPNHFPCVNHKDENKMNNSVSNLEWCTYKYNSNYGTCKKRLSLAMKGKRTNPIQENRRVYAKCVETNEIHHLNEWGRLGFQNVGKVCKGTYKHEKGFHFVYCNPSNKNVLGKVDRCYL